MSSNFSPYTVSLTLETDDESYVLREALEKYKEGLQTAPDRAQVQDLIDAAIGMLNVVEEAWLSSPNISDSKKYSNGRVQDSEAQA